MENSACVGIYDYLWTVIEGCDDGDDACEFEGTVRLEEYEEDQGETFPNLILIRF